MVGKVGWKEIEDNFSNLDMNIDNSNYFESVYDWMSRMVKATKNGKIEPSNI